MTSAAPLLRALPCPRRGAGAAETRDPPKRRIHSLVSRPRVTSRGALPFFALGGSTAERAGVQSPDAEAAFTILARNARGVLQVRYFTRVWGKQR
jgi:hypothetical protein